MKTYYFYSFKEEDAPYEKSKIYWDSIYWDSDNVDDLLFTLKFSKEFETEEDVVAFCHAYNLMVLK